MTGHRKKLSRIKKSCHELQKEVEMTPIQRLEHLRNTVLRRGELKAQVTNNFPIDILADLKKLTNDPMFEGMNPKSTEILVLVCRIGLNQLLEKEQKHVPVKELEVVDMVKDYFDNLE